MAQNRVLEVPIRSSITIPFHEGEVLRVELGRLTIVDGVLVRGRDCEIWIGGERIPGAQAAVLHHSTVGSVLGVVFKTGRWPDADDQLKKFRTAPVDAEFRVRHPDDGRVIRSYRILADTVIVNDREVDGWARVDFARAGLSDR